MKNVPGYLDNGYPMVEPQVVELLEELVDMAAIHHQTQEAMADLAATLPVVALQAIQEETFHQIPPAAVLLEIRMDLEVSTHPTPTSQVETFHQIFLEEVAQLLKAAAVVVVIAVLAIKDQSDLQVPPVMKEKPAKMELQAKTAM